jgi:hypothetical protein
MKMLESIKIRIHKNLKDRLFDMEKEKEDKEGCLDRYI